MFSPEPKYLKPFFAKYFNLQNKSCTLRIRLLLNNRSKSTRGRVCTYVMRCQIHTCSAAGISPVFGAAALQRQLTGSTSTGSTHTQTGPCLSTAKYQPAGQRGSKWEPLEATYPLPASSAWPRSWSISAAAVCCQPTAHGAQLPALPRSHCSPDVSTGNHTNT